MKKIPKFRLVAEPMTSEAAALPAFKWAGGDIGKRHQLGGEPEFIQKINFPTCSCGEIMSFYAQIDSINDDIVIADCGMIFLFLCFSCFESKSIVQSY
jgi:hypothetical protein